MSVIDPSDFNSPRFSKNHPVAMMPEDATLSSMMDNITRQMAEKLAAEVDKDILDSLKCGELTCEEETDEDLVTRMLKGDFEEEVGITFDKFIEAYNNLLENNPERLI